MDEQPTIEQRLTILERRVTKLESRKLRSRRKNMITLDRCAAIESRLSVIEDWLVVVVKLLNERLPPPPKEETP